MEIRQITDYRDLTHSKPAVLVLGYFDGLHLGHKALFDKASEIAKEKGLPITVLTFNESPKLAFVKYQDDLLLHLTNPEKRYDKFAEYGVDNLYLLNFTSDFAKTSSDDFIAHYIKGLQAEAVVVGFDYQFGHDQADGHYLAAHFEGQVYIVDEVQIGGEKVSSTRIRQLITSGKVKAANRLLGYDFSTRGIVVHGDARGRKIGFPTANLAPIDRTYLPANGVYVTETLIKKKRYRSMTSIGQNVTFRGTDLRLETHLLDFEGDIYGEEMTVYWLDYIRGMVSFNGVDDLKKQLIKDRTLTAHWTLSED